MIWVLTFIQLIMQSSSFYNGKLYSLIWYSDLPVRSHADFGSFYSIVYIFIVIMPKCFMYFTPTCRLSNWQFFNINFSSFSLIFLLPLFLYKSWVRLSRDHNYWIFGFTPQSVPISTKIMSLNPAHDEVYSMTTLCDKVTCDRLVVFSGYSSFLHQ